MGNKGVTQQQHILPNTLNLNNIPKAGPMVSLSQFYNTISDSLPILKETKLLLQKYINYRMMQVDNNSLYRTIMFSYIEFVLSARETLSNLIAAIEEGESFFALEEYPNVKENLLNYLKQIKAEQEGSIKAAQELFINMINFSSTFDSSLIKFVRIMVGNFISLNSDMKWEGRPLTQYLNNLSAEDYITKVVLEENLDANGIILQIIPVVLRINIYTFVLDHPNFGNFGYMEVSSATVTNINYIKEDLLDWHKFGISLISKSGRYSILYLKSPEIPVPQTLQSQKYKIPCCGEERELEWYRQQIISQYSLQQLYTPDKAGELRVPECIICKKKLNPGEIELFYSIPTFISEMENRMFLEYTGALLHLKEDYEEGSFIKLGKGGFGIVVKAYNKTMKVEQAIKIIETGRLGNNQKYIDREIQIVNTSQHKNIVNISIAYERGSWIFIVMDLYETDLEKYFWKHKKMDLIDILSFTTQICCGLEYLHSRKIIHRDIKLGNILMAREEGSKCKYTLKIGDFGLAKYISSEGTSTETLGVYGTPGCMAPEYMFPETPQDRSNPRVDIWSLGVILYQLLEDKSPFSNSPLSKIIQCEYAPLSHRHKKQWKPFFDLIFTPKEQRKTAGEIKSILNRKMNQMKLLFVTPCCGKGIIFKEYFDNIGEQISNIHSSKSNWFSSLFKVFKKGKSDFKCPFCERKVTVSNMKRVLPPLQLTRLKAILRSKAISKECKICNTPMDLSTIIDLNCAHSFHKACILAHTICPICKTPIQETKGYEGALGEEYARHSTMAPYLEEPEFGEVEKKSDRRTLSDVGGHRKNIGEVTLSQCRCLRAAIGEEGLFSQYVNCSCHLFCDHCFNTFCQQLNPKQISDILQVICPNCRMGLLDYKFCKRIEKYMLGAMANALYHSFIGQIFRYYDQLPICQKCGINNLKITEEAILCTNCGFSTNEYDY